MQTDADTSFTEIRVPLSDKNTDGIMASDPASTEAQATVKNIAQGQETILVPLSRVAYARSGDKGDSVNIGVIARTPALFPLLLSQVTSARVYEYFSHLVHGDIDRFELPGTHAINFLMTEALGGGGSWQSQFGSFR
ncbi:AtuA-related protein [Advenella kashmirensis]